MFSTKSNVPTLNTSYLFSGLTTISPDWLEEVQRYQAQPLSGGAVLDWSRVEGKTIDDFSVKWAAPSEAVLADAENNQEEASDADKQSGLTATRSSGHHATERKRHIDDQTFSNNSSLEQHQPCHSDKYSYKCDKCDEIFETMDKLERHNEDHNSRLLKCVICDFTCYLRSQLKEHVVAHSDERPCQCTLCPKKFRFSSELKRHQESHGNECPYKCDICNNTFKTAFCLARHKKFRHGNDVRLYMWHLQQAILPPAKFCPT